MCGQSRHSACWLKLPLLKIRTKLAVYETRNTRIPLQLNSTCISIHKSPFPPKKASYWKSEKHGKCTMQCSITWKKYVCTIIPTFPFESELTVSSFTIDVTCVQNITSVKIPNSNPSNTRKIINKMAEATGIKVQSAEREKRRLVLHWCITNNSFTISIIVQNTFSNNSFVRNVH